jgi:hypothetical protein
MTLNDYRLLTDEFTKMQQLWINGNEVHRRIKGASTFLLYQLKDFYVEVEFETDRKKIIAVKTFQDGILLDQYISTIDISTLLN